MDAVGCFEVRTLEGFSGELRAVNQLGTYEPSPSRRVETAPREVLEHVVLTLYPR